VGGHRGSAHIGAIDALKKKEIKIHSVFGNSMGAVIGGLYVTAPSSNLTARYRALISAYQKKTEESTPLYRKVAIWLRLTEPTFANKQFNDRYPGIRWTTARDVLAARQRVGPTQGRLGRQMR